MGPAASSPRLVRFGVFQLDLRSGELHKQGRRIRLEGQPIQVLMCLLENSGELVTREELHRRLWSADTYVNFEHGLNAAVKRLRHALSDSADKPRFVETLPRRGYRFIAPAHAVAESDDPPADTELASATVAAEEQQPAHAWKRWAIVFLVALALIVIWRLRMRSRQPAVIHSLAVLPLENLSGDTSQEYLSDGMTDELITELGQIREVRVISRTSVMTYKGTHKSLPQIARDLNVDAVLEGAVWRSENQVRITAQLIQVSDDKHLWAKSYEGNLQDTFAMEQQVARSIAEEIRVELTPHERAVLKDVRHVNADAYESYLKGRYFWNKRTADGLQKSITYFNEAVGKDPTYAQAYAGLADAYALLGDWEYGVLPPREAYPKAKAAATKALEIDTGLGEAHISLAFCLDGFDWDWESAGKEFRRGIELNPGYATAHHWYAWHLTALGRMDEAVAEMEKAESLDPLSLIIKADMAEELLIAHRFDDAIRQSRKTLSMDAFFAVAHYELGQAFLGKHMYDPAIAELQKAIELSAGSSTYTSNLAYAYAVSGRKKEAIRILNDLTNRPHRAVPNAPEIALIYVGLEDHGQAIAWLEKAYAERFNPTVLFRPAFDPLRPDPRFQSLVRRIGLVR